AGFVQRNLRWNLMALSFDYGLFGLGLTLASTSTVLAAFAERLGASNLVIGALPALQTVGWALPPALAANYTERQPRKMPLVLIVTVWERIPYLLMGVMALFLAQSNPRLALAILLFLVALMAFAGGSIMPAWMEVIAKVFPTRMRGRFFALGGVVSGVTGVGGAALVGYFLGNFAFPYSYAYCFFAAFVAMAGSFLFLSSTREQAVPSIKPVVGLGTYVRRLPGILRRDRNFAKYLAVRAFGVASNMGQAFFTVYALGRLGASDEQVAAFTLAVLLSQTVTTVIWGWLADRFGHKLVLVLGLTATALGNAIALLAHDPQVMYLSFAMMGAYLGALNISHLTIALEFAPPEDRPTYVGLAGTLMSPLAFGAPLVGGLFADSVGYSAVFALALVLASVSALGLGIVVRDPRHLPPTLSQG
ncbi:MAG: MFS transporter, partial [Chloroflexota bacterium]